MELVARPAKNGILAYWVRSFAEGFSPRPQKALDAAEAYAPAVVLVSSSGEEWVLQTTGSYRQAQAACRRFEAKRQAIGDVALCREVGAPDRIAELFGRSQVPSALSACAHRARSGHATTETLYEDH